jgi:hypothetical protein
MTSFDDSAEFNDIPDNLNNIPQNNYPLAITFWKFFMMLDGTLCTSFFDRFYGELTTLHEGGKSKSRALQDYIKMKEVGYEKVSCSLMTSFQFKSDQEGYVVVVVVVFQFKSDQES